MGFGLGVRYVFSSLGRFRVQGCVGFRGVLFRDHRDHRGLEFRDV